MQWLLVVFLVLLNVLLLWFTQEPENLVEVRRRYHILVDHIRGDVPEKFHALRNYFVITSKKGGLLGYNTNKGFEIGICLDGTPNDMFHVLLHELAHSMDEETGDTHTQEFWKNLSELKDMAVNLGIYERIQGKRQFCGEYLWD